MKKRTARYNGTRIFEILDARGQRLDWLAAQVGCNASLLSHIKAGRRPVPGWMVPRAVAAMGVPEDVLFFDPVLPFASDVIPSESELPRVA